MGLDLPPCRNNDTMFLAGSRAHDIYRALENPELTGCPRSCRQVSYRPDLTVQPSSLHSNHGQTGLFVYMSNNVETVEEYLLFDASEIVTAVGGSLGLFLGFSCLSVVSYFGSLFARFNATGRKIILYQPPYSMWSSWLPFWHGHVYIIPTVHECILLLSKWCMYQTSIKCSIWKYAASTLVRILLYI